MRIKPALVLNWTIPVTTLVAWELFGRLDMLPRYLSVPTLIVAALWELAVSGELLVGCEAANSIGNSVSIAIITVLPTRCG